MNCLVGNSNTLKGEFYTMNSYMKLSRFFFHLLITALVFLSGSVLGEYSPNIPWHWVAIAAFAAFIILAVTWKLGHKSETAEEPEDEEEGQLSLQ